MKYNFYGFIVGGEGPDVWEKECDISAVDFSDASTQVMGIAERLGGTVVQLEQNDRPENSEDKLTTLRANLERLAERWEEERTECGTHESHGLMGSMLTDFERVLAGETPPETGKEWK